MKVLIVDDESLVRRSLERVCLSRGHSVEQAEDGMAGLEIWNRWQPDVVFLDVLMPKLSGLEVLKRLPADRSAKVILMSAYTGSTNSEQALSAGADLFLSKPFQDIFSVLNHAEELCSDQRASK